MLAAQCDVIEQLDAAHKTNLMHSQIRLVLVTGWKDGRNFTTCIENNEGNIIMEKEKILSRWYEYIGELYNETWLYRKMLRISWKDRIINDDVSRRMRTVKTLMGNIVRVKFS